MLTFLSQSFCGCVVFVVIKNALAKAFTEGRAFATSASMTGFSVGLDTVGFRFELKLYYFIDFNYIQHMLTGSSSSTDNT